MGILDNIANAFKTQPVQQQQPNPALELVNRLTPDERQAVLAALSQPAQPVQQQQPVQGYMMPNGQFQPMQQQPAQQQQVGLAVPVQQPVQQQQPVQGYMVNGQFVPAQQVQQQPVQQQQVQQQVQQQQPMMGVMLPNGQFQPMQQAPNGYMSIAGLGGNMVTLDNVHDARVVPDADFDKMLDDGSLARMLQGVSMNGLPGQSQQEIYNQG